MYHPRIQLQRLVHEFVAILVGSGGTVADQLNRGNLTLLLVD